MRLALVLALCTRTNADGSCGDMDVAAHGILGDGSTDASDNLRV